MDRLLDWMSFGIFVVIRTDKILIKVEIVNEIFQKTGADGKEAFQIVEGYMGSVKRSLTDGENVYLRGFSRFIVKYRAEKVGRNINRNTSVVVSAPMFLISNRLTALD